MNKLLKTMELHNINYKKNNLPEYLVFDVHKNIDTFVHKLEPIFENSNKVLKQSWHKWKTNYYNNISNSHLNCGLVLVYTEKGILKSRLTLDINKKYIDKIQLKYTFNNKVERISLNELMTLNKMSGHCKVGYYHDIYYLETFDNISDIYLYDNHNGSKEVSLIIEYPYL